MENKIINSCFQYSEPPISDHSLLTNLNADDHTQYALLAGRNGGQTLNGSTLASENITINSTSNATKGTITFDGWSRKVFPTVNGTNTISELATLDLTANKAYFVKAYILGRNGTTIEGAYAFELSRCFYRNSAGTTITPADSEIVFSTSADPYNVTFEPTIEVKDASSIKVSITYGASSSPKDHYWSVTLLWKEL
jgi:hypothetical protein